MSGAVPGAIGPTGPCYRAGVDTTNEGGAELRAWWLGRVEYRAAWDLQHRLVERRRAGAIPDQLLLLEHGPVLTLGRHADPGHVRASPGVLDRRGIEVVRVERGGEVTYHGPGQLVGYPIVDLRRRGVMVRPFVAALEAALATTCAAFGVEAGPRPGHPGCWCDPDGPEARKIGALGIRVERGVAYHGIALNVSVDLDDFELIDACGLPGVSSTSIAREAGWTTSRPSTDDVAQAAAAFASAFARRLGARLAGGPPSDGPWTSAAIDEVLRTAVRPAGTPSDSASLGAAGVGGG